MKKEKSIKEKSCGAIVYKINNNQIKFLLINSIKGIWGFSKGHVENNESEIDTALREVLEETNLKVNIIDGFRITNNYSFDIDGKIIDKEVVLFLATFLKQRPKAQKSEVSKIIFADYKKAISLFQFKNNVEILKQAYNFIVKKIGQINSDLLFFLSYSNMNIPSNL